MTTTRDNPSIVESIENFFEIKHSNHYTIFTLDPSASEQLSQNKDFFHNKVKRHFLLR